MGGVVTDEALAARPHNKTNADYVFPDDGVVAELKCLELDWADELAKRAPAVTEEWMRRGKIPHRTGTFNLPDLPLPLVREILDPFRKRIKQNILKKSDKQIRQTRLEVGRETDKGLLIVVNDGNLALPPDMMAHLLYTIFKGESLSAIHSIAYVTVNQPVKVDAPFHKFQFWITWKMRGEASVSVKFIERFADAWLGHVSVVLAPK